jgi:hypothetical protein
MRFLIYRRIQARLQAILQRIRKRKEPEPPEDPFAYVTAPRRPRTPNRSAAAVAEWPEE